MEDLGISMEFLRKVELFRDLSDQELQLIEASSRIRQLEKGDILFKKGQRADFFYVIIDGELKETASDSNNFSESFWEDGRYDYFGELGIFLNEGYCSSVVAMTDVSVLAVPRERLLRLAEMDNRILLTIIRRLRNRLQVAVQKEIGHTQMNAEGRLAYSLSCIYGKREQGNKVFVTQDQLAASCGIARQTASKILNAWKKDGIVELGRGSIVILNDERLTEIYLMHS